ncbi:glycosyltransferase family 2 protein [Candidatus Woesearchaeota archaeon]|nr:glycosyltransferase family 2 protein [Candidatus Woesearchaeota archaeon]
MKMLLENIPGVITAIFLAVILSYYLLLFARVKKTSVEKNFRSVTVIIPAHNEEDYIKQCIESVLIAEFEGKKQIIVVDDGSIDDTFKIASVFKKAGVVVLKTKHSGKSASINLALKKAAGEVVCIVDGDSVIERNALSEIIKEVGRKNVAGATGVVKVKNRKKHILMWVHIEQIYNSLMRYLFSKINANVVTPGPLSAYRKKDLLELKGFSTEGFSEDMDITVRLIRSGKKIGFNEKAVALTNMPYDMKGFLRQRTRFARGMVFFLKKHMRLNTAVIDVYTLPLMFFAYVQAIIMGGLTIYQLVSGYVTYFFSKGIYFSLSVLKFFFEWFSLVGFSKWTYNVLVGVEPLSFVAIIGILSTLLSYPLFLFAIIKFDKKIDLLHIIPFFFMFPFWLLIMVIYILMAPEIFKKSQRNIWKKNEP